MDETLKEILENITSTDELLGDIRRKIKKWVEDELERMAQKEIAFFTDEQKGEIIEEITKKKLEEIKNKI